ncbi:MAG: TonB-dependent receptor [Betaproteobacteria bacterium]|nr:TonB-dependent receptor [Betaproteobacteria bacterium]
MNARALLLSSRSPGRPKNDLAPSGGGSGAFPEPGALLITALLALASPAAAQDATPDAGYFDMDLEQLLQVDYVLSAGKFPQKITDAPSRVTIITADEIKTQGYRTLADVLGAMRGLYLTYDRNYTYLGTRGFARAGDYNTRIQLMVDGVRIDDPVYNQASIGQEFPIDLDLVERVEFLPGPGSAAYGNNAFLGLVHVITKRPAALDGAQTAFQLGDHGGRGARASLARTLDNGGELLLAVSAWNQGGGDLYYPEFNVAPNDGWARGLDDERTRRAFAKYAGNKWTLQALWGERVKGIPTASFGTIFGDSASETRDAYTRLSARRDFTWSERTQGSLQFHYGRYDFRGDYVYDSPPRTLNRDVGRGDRWGMEGKIQHSADRHLWSLWAEALRDSEIVQRNFDVDPYRALLDERRQTSSHALFVQDEITLNERWLTSLGVRWDRVHTGESVVNPRLALIHKARPDTTLKLLYGSAFRAPNHYERDYAVAGFNKGNPDLKPERIRTLEAVAEYRASGLRLAASAYLYKVRDLISQALDANDGLWVFRNGERVQAQGLELEAEYAWSDGERLRGSLTSQTTRNESTDQTLTNSPRTMAKLHWSRPWRGDLRSGLEVQHISARTTAATRLAGTTLVNLNLVSTRLGKGVEVTAGVQNLMDKRYSHPASLDHTQTRIEQDGRTWRVGLSYRFD